MRWERLWGLLVALLLAAGPVVAQTTGQITGTVTDAVTGQPLAGAQVTVSGRQQGAVTAANGAYTINGVPAGSYTVRATLLGRIAGEATVRVTAGQPATANFQLRAEPVALEEVVVVGYGTARRRDVTGAVTSVQADEISEQPVARVDQALAGRAAGVEIQTTNNQPGAEMRIRIRGGNSLQGSNDPLIVVDGVLGADLNQINPNDIASIDVLKDASSTAIYGARGANGVILVTTKRGRPGQTRVDYSGYYGMQEVSHRIDLLTAAEQATLINADPNSTLHFDNPAALGTGTDWQDVIFRTAPMQSHQISVTGGAENTRFLLSGSYLQQDGVIRASDFNRSTLRLNLDQEVSSRFRVGTRLSYARSIGNGARINGSYGTQGGPITHTALLFSPIIPVLQEDGTYSGPLVPGTQLDNPLAILNERNDVTTRNYFLGNAFGEYDLLRGLSLRSSFSYRTNDRVNEQYTGRLLLAAANLGSATIDNGHNTDWLAENTLTYQHSFGENRLDVVGGVTAERERNHGSTATGRGFPSDLLGFNGLDLASTQTVASSANSSSLLSYLGRVNYSIAGKYLFTLSGRGDGSSKFARNNKWAFFPSAAVAWRVSEEPFLAGVGAMSDLKLRASYGKTGSQAIGAYQSLAAYSLGNRYAWGLDFFTNGVRPSRIENPNLKWETTSQYDAGMDLSLFGNGLTVTADYYHKTTSDLLYQKILPSHSGYSSQIQNVGSLRNQGVELALDGEHEVGPVSVRLGGNISFNRNEVLDLGGDEQFTASGANGSLPRFANSALVRVGEPVGNFYGWIWDGIFQNQAEVAASGQSGAIVGGMKLRDISGPDGTPDGVINDLDRTILGNALPDYTFGVNGMLRYSDLDLSFTFRGVQGNQIVNLGRQGLSSPGSTNNQLASTMNYWTPENPTNEMTGLLGGNYDGMTSRWLEDGSFVRLQNLTLGYTVPASVGNFARLRNLRLYLSAQNLFTWTKYSWFDPEISSRGDTDIELGWDDGGYPGTRTVTLGLNVGF